MEAEALLLLLRQVVEELAAQTPGKRSLAMQAFARALQAIPTTICDNAGLDSAELVRALHCGCTPHGDGNGLPETCALHPAGTSTARAFDAREGGKEGSCLRVVHCKPLQLPSL